MFDISLPTDRAATAIAQPSVAQGESDLVGILLKGQQKLVSLNPHRFLALEFPPSEFIHTPRGLAWSWISDASNDPILRIVLQGCDFSDFSLISDFFPLTHVKIILLIPHLEQVSHDFIIDSDFQRKFLYHFRPFH